MSIINIKFTKFDNTPWGFRLAGGSDFPQPLTVIKVLEGSLAECMGLKPGDVVVRLNDLAVSGMTHGQAHEALKLAGNNFSLSVHRTEEALAAVEAIQEDNIVPYTIPLDELKPVLSESSDESSSDFGDDDDDEEEDKANRQQEEKPKEKSPEKKVETLPEKPVDDNSEIVANKNLTDDEIARLILEEEELLPAGEQGVLGVNFKKLRPRAPILKESKVLEELQKIAVEEPPRLLELKHKSTFLQKPERPVPQLKNTEEQRQNGIAEGYKVIIKKQPKKTVYEKLLASGRLEPLKTPEPYPEISTMHTPAGTPELEQCSRPTSAASRVYEIPIEVEGRESKSSVRQEDTQSTVEEPVDDERSSTPCENNVREATPPPPEPPKPIFDKAKVKELVSTEISLEKQLESVQMQLLALKQLPSEIENHLKIVSEQLHKIMELSGVNSRRSSTDEESKKEATEQEKEEEGDEGEERRSSPEEPEESNDGDRTQTPDSDVKASPATISSELPVIIEPEMEQVGPPETQELEVTLTTVDDHVKKCVASYETKIFRSREPSPAPSHGSYEPDPNLSAKDQVIQELKQHKAGRKRSQDLWPQAKQLELTYGRRWRCPNDFFNDEMIAEVLSGQAEVIRGRALGVNFKKYEKAWLPNYDHLMNSSVYRMLHKMEREPKTGIPARPSKVPAAQDIIERVRTPMS